MTETPVTETPASNQIQHPLPYASWETRGYWEGAGREQLVIQRCASCGTAQHKPRAVCATCLTGDLEHVVASGRGTVYTFTVTNQNQAPGFADACPYVMAYVDLEEGVRVLANIVGCDVNDVVIGMPVAAEFVVAEREDGEPFAVPVFTPVGAP